MAGYSRLSHFAMAASFRSYARRIGCCTLKPQAAKERPTVVSDTVTSPSRAINDATAARVQR
jgi:hypothetical protein